MIPQPSCLPGGITWRYVSYLFPAVFSWDYGPVIISALAGLIRYSLFIVFPSLSYFPTSYCCFLNPPDKLPALKSLSQDYSGHFHQVVSPVPTPPLKCLVQWVDTGFKPSQLESFPRNFVQSEIGRKELSSLSSFFLLPIVFSGQCLA